MKNIVKIPFALTILSIALVGCSSKKTLKIEEPKPNALPTIQATQSLARVMSTSTASAPKHDPSRFQMVQFDGVFYTASPNGEVTALQNGKRLWQVRPTKALSAGVSVAQGVAVVADEKGRVFALDAKTGQTLWQQNLTGSVLSPSLIHQNRVITVTNDGTVYANDLATGQTIWTFDLPSVALSVRGYAAPVAADQRTVVIATADAYVYALDVITGVPSWQRRVAVSEGRGDVKRLVDVDGQPQVMGSKLVTVSYQGQVTVTDLSNQQVLWTERASSLNSPAVSQQAVYVANADGHIVAYDLYNGSKLWENDSLAYRKLSNPVILGNHLVVGDYQGILHLIDPATGQINGREKTSGDVRTLRVENDQLYVATTKGEFSVWQAR